MLKAFQPNKQLSSREWTLLLAVEGGLFLLLWSAADVISIPGPLDCLKELGRLITQDGLLYDLFVVSFKINLEAIFLTVLFSQVLAYLTVLPVMRPIGELCSKFRFLPMTGLVTPFTLAFGGGHALKVALLTFGMSVFYVTSMYSVVAGIPRSDWDQARSLRMSPWRAVREVVIYGKADEAFDVLRQNAAMGWMMLTMVEGLVRSEGGIGSILLNQAKYRHWDAVFAIMGTLLFLGMLQDRGIVGCQNFFCRHSKLKLERI